MHCTAEITSSQKLSRACNHRLLRRLRRRQRLLAYCSRHALCAPFAARWKRNGREMDDKVELVLDLHISQTSVICRHGFVSAIVLLRSSTAPSTSRAAAAPVPACLEAAEEHEEHGEEEQDHGGETGPHADGVVGVTSAAVVVDVVLDDLCGERFELAKLYLEVYFS